MLKDHLGNVRMVLTDEVKTINYPKASMENVPNKNDLTNTDNYMPYYSNTDYTVASGVRELKSTIDNPPPSGTTSPNDYWAKLSSQSGGRKTGPGILLKVMAGDKIELACEMWWRGNINGSTTKQSPLNDILLQLAAGLTGSVGGGKINSGQAGSNGSFFSPAVSSFMNQQNPDVGDRPKAFLNWLFLDEQFNYQSTNGSGAEPVDASSNHYKTYTRFGSNAIPVKQSGYVYIYTSNESSVAAFFDNLDVNHVQGPLLEETHYYPFGLTMAGISSKAAGGLENKFKFNEGTELNSSLEISIYETDWRLYDPQLGRFHQVDRLGEINASVSGFVFASNNPISINDPTGLTDNNPKTDTLRAVGTTGSGEVIYSNGQELNPVKITQNTRDKKNPGISSFYANVSLFRSRYNNHLPLIQEYDRQSYIDGLENGSILRTVERQEDAEQFERDVYTGLATMVSLPFEVPALVGLVAKGRQFTTVFVAVNRHYGMKTAVSASLKSVRAGSFTRSNLKLGAAMHNIYESNLIRRGLAEFPEFGIKGFGRADAINLSKRVIYELKPNNVESILQGLQQLDRYRAGMYYNTERIFKTVLDLY